MIADDRGKLSKLIGGNVGWIGDNQVEDSFAGSFDIGEQITLAQSDAALEIVFLDILACNLQGRVTGIDGDYFGFDDIGGQGDGDTATTGTQV